ncbi:MAG: cation:proton antiporter [Candidatus Omnitrophica bacterium]|nr:cation:proton antiporter [Candidatus Omnitrophota bacterium]
MPEQIRHLLNQISLADLNILLLLGLSLFSGTIGAKLFQKLKIPQVVGYIFIGIIAGQSGLQLISKEMIAKFQPFNYFALGLIGFMIGGELKKETFKKYGKTFIAILLAEGIMAFLVVFFLVGLIATFFFPQTTNFWILGLLLGSIASATAPAATTDVLWEYKTRGPLTTTILGIVAMDDALALFLFAISSSLAYKFLGTSHEGIIKTIFQPVYDIAGAIIIGTIAGLMLVTLIKRRNDPEKILAFSVGSVLLTLGISQTLKVDMLLASMTLGVVIVNSIPRISKQIFSLVSGFASPIYVLFFVLVGAKLNILKMNQTTIVLTLIYLIGRTSGKMFGAFAGAKLSHAAASVQKYLPFCLFSQAGIAIGLSIIAYHLFPGEIGDTIVIVVTASTFIVQLIGPIAVKYAVEKAGETGLNVSEDDILSKINVSDILTVNAPTFKETTPLETILRTFKNNELMYFPVIKEDKTAIGVVTVDSIRQTFMEQALNNFILAHDIMEPVSNSVYLSTPIKEANELLSKKSLDYLIVIKKNGSYCGLITRRAIDKYVSTKLIEIERKTAELVG